MRVLDLSELDEVSGGCGRKRTRCGSSKWGKGSGKNSGKCGGKNSGKDSGKGSGKGCTPPPVCPPVDIPEVPVIPEVP
jgi:hypothetical protein